MTASSSSLPSPGSAPDLDAQRRARLTAPAEGGTPSLKRHPADGWRLADPWPMGRVTLGALRGLVVALTPPPPAPVVPPERIVAHVRRIIRYLPHIMTRGFVLTVHLLDWSPLWRGKSWHRLRALPPARAAAVLDGLAESRWGALRQLIMAARGVVLSTYFDQPEVHDALDYHPEPYLRGRLALRARLLASEPTTPGDQLGPFSPDIRPDLALPAPNAPRGARVAPKAPATSAPAPEPTADRSAATSSDPSPSSKQVTP